MDNPIPRANAPLCTLAEDMADGAHTHEAAIGLKQNKEADLRADLATARAAQQAVDAAKQAKKDASTAQTVADSNAKSFIGITKNALETALGKVWSADWGVVGFPTGSLAIPGVIADRQELSKKIAAWLTANPAREIPALGFTVAAANAAFNGLSDARSAFNQATTVIGQKLDARDTAVTALTTRMRGMIAELGQLLDDNDPRWYAFGLNAPGDPATPGIPDGLALTPGTAGNVYVDWADARRAEGYHVFKQIVGVDADPVRVATVDDSDATLPGLPSGKTVKITVTATNTAGESQPCDPVEIVIP